jgi:hypothetical protein
MKILKSIKEILLFISGSIGICILLIISTLYIYDTFITTCTGFCFMDGIEIIIYGSILIFIASSFLTYLIYKKFKKIFYAISILSLTLIIGFCLTKLF